MRILAPVCYVSLLACLVPVALAQNKSQVGTWKCDLSKSDFGRDPAPQSVTVTIMKDSPEMGSFRVRIVDHSGKIVSYSWSGPEDGSMHPVKDAAGKTLEMQSLKKQPNGTLLRHGEDSSDGSSFDATDTMSGDGKSIFEEITEKSKDGTATKLRHVYHRSATASNDKTKSQ